MDVVKARKALKSLARQKGVSVDTIRREIEIAIESALQNPDPEIQAFWLTVPRKGTSPTPEEVITYIAEIAQNQARSTKQKILPDEFLGKNTQYHKKSRHISII